jgi:hypothetical protein
MMFLPSLSVKATRQCEVALTNPPLRSKRWAIEARSRNWCWRMCLANNGLQCVCVQGALTPFSRLWITILLVLLQQPPHKEGILSVGETPDDVEMSWWNNLYKQPNNQCKDKSVVHEPSGSGMEQSVYCSSSHLSITCGAPFTTTKCYLKMNDLCVK